MSFTNNLVFKLKRSNSWPARMLKKSFHQLLSPTLPALPRFLLPPFRAFYELRYSCLVVWKFLMKVCYYNPVTQSRCATVGDRFSVEGMPFITGHAEIHVGNNVGLGGLITISSGAVFEKPQLIIKDGARLGWGATITVNREVVIEEDVFISYNCNISDSDGHPREADLRVAGARPFEKDIRPVRIGRYAWIGNGTYIMKGVTVGEGAVIGANSVVISNVPPYCLALGNPAEILFKNYGLPSTARRAKKPLEPPAQQV